MQVVFINYDDAPNIYGRVCTALGLLQVYTESTKLFFTVSVAFHLFCFAVLHKNLKKLEVMYVVTSLLIPALIAIVPLVTHAYGLSPGGNICYIYANTSVAFIERLALWDGPAMLMLIAVSTAMVAMVIKLASQVCRRSKYEPITDGDQFWKALKQLLPLATFPLMFFIFEIPVFLYHVYTTQHSTPNEGMFIADVVCFPLWSASSGATVIIHISVARICGRKRKHIKQINLSESYSTGSHANSETHFPFPPPRFFGWSCDTSLGHRFFGWTRHQIPSRLQGRGLAMVFNPTGSTLSWNLTLPLYYTGISNKAQVFREGISPPTIFSLDRDYSISIPVKMTPTSITWFLIWSGD
eukprot:Em0007g481a